MLENLLISKNYLNNKQLLQIECKTCKKYNQNFDDGSTYYTIKDLGKADVKFVKEQFDLFIHKLHFKESINKLNTTNKMFVL